MKKLNLKLFTALLAVALVASMSIFYACEKEEKDNNSKNSKVEAKFVAKNYDGSCVQVTVFRDGNGNAQFVIEDVAADLEIAIGFTICATLDLEPRQAKNGESFVTEIPNDAIYWVVPLDGNEPLKIEPIITKAAVGIGIAATSTLKCDCYEWDGGGTGKCKPENGVCKRLDRCTRCRAYNSVHFSTGEETTFVGSTYLVKSDVITINGILYE